MPFRIKKTSELILLFLIYAVCIALASTLWKYPAMLTGCYALVSVLILLKWHTRADVVAYAATAVLGPLCEAISIHHGAWTYSKSAFLVPLWLPLLWGVAGFFLRRLISNITNRAIEEE